jgi:hypothetical protein
MTPLELTVTEAGCEELHVRGTPVMMLPMESVTVGVTVAEPLLEKVMEVVGVPLTSNEIDCTGQVMNGIGELVALLTVA